MSKSDSKKTIHSVRQTISKSYKTIKCPEYDPNKNFQRDHTGFYVLIRVNFEIIKIELAVCNKEHEIVANFQGNKSQDIYHSLFTYEKRHKKKWFENKSHIAYIGKELKKAELALASGSNSYYQE